MEKIIIIIISVIILLTIFLCRFKYFVNPTGERFIRVNRITGTAKVFEWKWSVGRYQVYKASLPVYKFEEE